jgi:ATP-dependent DNA helicase RecQ
MLLSATDRLAQAREVLQRHFGYADFRPLQRRVIHSVLARRDTLGVLPTGGGKSICYQVPALVLGRLTVVISPLIALMQDQVAALTSKGIPAALLNSLVPREEQQATLTRIRRNEIRLLYLAPERAPRLADELAQLGVQPALLAVDEAHCISEWGHDFRPSYRGLARVRSAMGDPPCLALTGSATQEVRADLSACLGLRRPVIHLGSFDRPNLRFDVMIVSMPGHRLGLLVTELRRRPGLAIVYVPTRNLADGVARALRFGGIRAEAYHAALSKERRIQTLQHFLGNELEAVAATSAFGMGIDAPRVRLVAHWGIPPTPEAYYQEAGRAGRDGKPATCLLLHHPNDGVLHRRQLDVTFPPRRLLQSLWRGEIPRSRVAAEVLASADRLARELHTNVTGVEWSRVEARRRKAENRIRAMEHYASTGGCRRAMLLEYFGERVSRCAACDRCAPRPAQGTASIR